MLVDSELKDKLDYITFEDAYLDENNVVWFPSYELNGLFSYDIGLKQLNYVVGFEEYGVNASRLFSGVVGWANKIFLCPMEANYIAIYDKQSNKLSKLMLADVEILYKKSAKCWGILCYKETVYMIGHSYPAIIKINGKSESAEYFILQDRDVLNMTASGKDIFRNNFWVKDNLLFLPCCCKNAVYIFDLESCKGQFVEVGSMENCYSGLCFDGHDFWLSPLEGDKLVQWNYEENTCNEYKLGNHIYEQNKRTYLGCLYFKGKVFLIPAFGMRIAIMDVETQAVRFCDLETNSMAEPDAFPVAIPFRSYCVYDDAVCLLCKKNGYIYKYDFENDVFKMLHEGMFFLRGQLLDVMKQKNGGEVIWISKSVEDNSIYLPLFFQTLKKNGNNQNNGQDENVGHKIWNCIKEHGE